VEIQGVYGMYVDIMLTYIPTRFVNPTLEVWGAGFLPPRGWSYAACVAALARAFWMDARACSISASDGGPPSTSPWRVFGPWPIGRCGPGSGSQVNGHQSAPSAAAHNFGIPAKRLMAERAVSKGNCSCFSEISPLAK
jgi:hypothetical protein